MGLFSKDEKVLKIPKAPELPKLSSPEKRELSELPSFPPSSKNENFNQEMVKSAVADLPSPEEEEVSVDIPSDFHVREEPSGESLIPPRPSENSIPDLPRQTTVANLPKRTLELSATKSGKSILKESEPIFVRIDKFQTAQKNFEKIKGKIKEIESVISKIKSVKSQEEVELKGWAEDIEKIKSRLAELDSGIFSQI